MTSILTNTGAMVALQTLSMINQELTKTQADISTGKHIATAADNASIWAVTSIMQSDVDGFEAIAESLSLGKATVSVARNASEKITELLRDVKEKIVAAQGENIDRGKIQADIDELEAQIASIVASAQFNGLNLIDGSATGNVNVLSSLDRDANGLVNSNSIVVARQDLSTDAIVVGASAGVGAALANETVAAAVSTASTTISDGSGNTGSTIRVTIDGVNYGDVIIPAGTANDAPAQLVADYIDGLNIDGLTTSVSTDNSGTLTLTTSETMDDVVVVLSAVAGENDSVGTSTTQTLTLEAANTQTINSTDTHASTFTIGRTGTTDTFTLDVSIDGTAITQIAVAATSNNAAIGLALANQLNLLGLTGVTASADPTTGAVTLNNATGSDLDVTIQVGGAGGTDDMVVTFADNDAASATPDVVTDEDATAQATATALGTAADLAIAGGTLSVGDTYQLELRTDIDNDGTLAADETVTFTYFVQNGDDVNDVANGLKDLVALDSRFDNVNIAVTESTNPTSNPATIEITSTEGEVIIGMKNNSGGTQGGGLGLLAGIDVTSNAGANQAMADIETLIQNAVDASAAFGSSENRIDIQTEFVQSLVDAMRSGIGALVDTDMEAASARLQALQVQQQLGTQALAIANATPQNILALFQ